MKERPNFVRCVDAGSNDITNDKIYPCIGARGNDMYKIINDRGEKEDYFMFRFESATEEEYLAYQASLNPLKQVDDELDALYKHHEKVITETDKKQVDEIMDGILKTAGIVDKAEKMAKAFVSASTDKTFAISDDQIKFLLDSDYERVKFCLKEWFPAASVFAFKKEEKTYRIGNRFKETKEDKEYILCNAGSVNQVVLVCLVDGYSYTYAAYVKDVRNITKEEMEYIAGEDRFKNFVLLS